MSHTNRYEMERKRRNFIKLTTPSPPMVLFHPCQHTLRRMRPLPIPRDIFIRLSQRRVNMNSPQNLIEPNVIIRTREDLTQIFELAVSETILLPYASCAAKELFRSPIELFLAPPFLMFVKIKQRHIGPPGYFGDERARMFHQHASDRGQCADYYCPVFLPSQPLGR